MLHFSSKEEERHYFEQQADEATFLRWYRQQDLPVFEKPSLTVDLVILSYDKQLDQLKLLLIQRKANPYRLSWALPGGFVNKNESTDESALRETLEETGVVISQNHIEQLYTFSRPNRDPRGWVVTVSYLAFIGQTPLQAGDDAKDVRWFNMTRHDNLLSLENEGTQITLDLVEGKTLSAEQLAFDHAEIIVKAFNRIVNKMTYEPKVLRLLGDQFTITEARKVFAKFLGVDYKTIDHSNFKKAMVSHFHEIGERPAGIGRPSKLYQLKNS